MDKSYSENRSTIILCICVVDEHFSLKNVHVNRVEIQTLINPKANGSNPINELKEIFSSGSLLQLVKSDTTFCDEILAEIRSFCNSDPISSHKYHLTNKEKEVLNLLIDGRTKKEISKILFVSQNTIGTHINHIYHKLNVTSRGSVVAKAIKEKLHP